ncbi:hypothetical protein [Xenorhabdus bovienii]|uniref:Uncharacterized protein n=1 Tax=Xenorhabdus bovienii str. kraussei Becker Underwood TaxID=1398204 RepID=A0A077PWU8_XENBV|nr:hypothetical protein [Xenorhabdus bovienii]CDH24364.1 conserved hypothetical protein [Xenorhabdus bovienii str. kraussei Becker Underwood]
MRGVVVHHEHRIKFITIRNSRGEFILAELLGGYLVENGDVISGSIEYLGSQALLNETKNQQIHVFVQDIGLTEKQAIRRIQGTRQSSL